VQRTLSLVKVNGFMGEDRKLIGSGSDIEVYKRMDNAQPQDEILEKVLNNLVWSVVKQSDAPMSSSTHFNTALYDLLRLVPGYRPPAGQEGRDVIVEAVTEIKMLGGS
jgi:hypothetical protein